MLFDFETHSIKIFLRSTMTNQSLTALAMLSTEKPMITEMKDFNIGFINNLRAKEIDELTVYKKALSISVLLLRY